MEELSSTPVAIISLMDKCTNQQMVCHTVKFFALVLILFSIGHLTNEYLYEITENVTCQSMFDTMGIA